MVRKLCRVPALEKNHRVQVAFVHDIVFDEFYHTTKFCLVVESIQKVTESLQFKLTVIVALITRWSQYRANTYDVPGRLLWSDCWLLLIASVKSKFTILSYLKGTGRKIVRNVTCVKLLFLSLDIIHACHLVLIEYLSFVKLDAH